ncbi:MAG: M48 family metallopeptidase [Acidobacteria bacterium]|nr:M48 family metallopeptidase [Acidobacteriota bacterium]
MKRLGIFFGIVTIAGGIAIGLQAARSESGEEDSAASEVLEEAGLTVTEEMRRHSLTRNVIYFGGAAASWIALAVLLWSGWSRRIRNVSERVTDGRLGSRLLYAALLVTALSLMLFPIELYAGFIVPHQYDLSNQSFAEWLIEGVKGFLIAVVLSAPLMAGVLALIDRWPKRWWLAAWALSVPLTIVLVFLAPIVIEPLFNDFKPLGRSALEKRLLNLANDVGIADSRVFEVDKSKQTRTLNAYVTGVGTSKRIVIWDTLLDAMSDDEVVFVMAHEMGHDVRHDLWKGMAFSAVVTFAAFGLGSIVIARGISRFGRSWGARGPSDPVVLPWMLLSGSVLMFLISPGINAYSRAVERRADLFALEHTGLATDGASAFATLAKAAKTDPDPHPFIRFWRYGHPTIVERIELALRWDEEHARTGDRQR